ncbi:MAG: amidohydrolase family protein [Gammaproteobacteria bacterium]
MKRYLFLLIIVNCVSAIIQAQGVQIITAREIITLDEAAQVGDAIAVEDGLILKIGSLESLKKFFPNAVINRAAQDSVIVPGFIEHHIHPFLAAVTMNSKIIAIDDWKLPYSFSKGVRNREEYFEELIKAEDSSNKEEPFISWGYHHYFHGSLTRQDLDNISSSRPIIIIHRSFHEFILNSAAMEVLDIKEENFDIPEVDKEFANFSEGHFSERGAILVLGNLMKLLGTPEMLINGMKSVIEHLHSNGVTVIGNPGAMYNPNIQMLKNMVFGNKQIPLESFFIPSGLHLIENYDISEVLEKAESQTLWGEGNLSYLSKQIKLFSDGAMYSQNMMMRDGYLDGHQGAWLIHENIYKQLFKIFWDNNYQIHVHQNGDAGLDRVLNVLEENLILYPRKDHRTTVVHFGYSADDQVQRIKDLGVLVSANPYYVTTLSDLYSREGVGYERTQDMVRLGDLERADILFSLHSDMPMAPAAPLVLMDSAMNRLNFANKVAGPDQRISALTALKAVTLNAAYIMQLEDRYGSISIGKVANFTVLDSNPLSVNPLMVKDIKVVGTFSNGKYFPVLEKKM